MEIYSVFTAAISNLFAWLNQLLSAVAGSFLTICKMYFVGLTEGPFTGIERVFPESHLPTDPQNNGTQSTYRPPVYKEVFSSDHFLAVS